MARKRVLLLLMAALAIAGASVAVAQASTGGRSHRHDGDWGGGGQGGGSGTATPIKHVVVIFQENVSFDHYFGTYPNAANTDGQTFHAAPGTPAVDGLPPATSNSLPPNLRHTTNLLTTNPNAASRSGSTAAPTGVTPGTAVSSRATRTTTTATSSRRSTAARWTSSSRAPAPARGNEPVRHAVQRPRRSWTTTTATPSRACGTTPSTSR